MRQNFVGNGMRSLGLIALRYLGIPAFSDIDGLSGGLVATAYAKRTHPLHDLSLIHI